MKIVDIVCRAAVTVTLLLTFSASSWGQTSLDNAPVGSQAADEAARARGGPVQPVCRRDTTPHKVTFVEVEPGVKLEVLDWGGSGEVMVLLTGVGRQRARIRLFCISVHRFLPRHWDHPPWMAAIEPAQKRLRCRDKGG